MGSHSCHGSYRGVSSYHSVNVRGEAAGVLNDVDMLFMMRFFMQIFILVFVGILMSVSVESLVTFEQFAFTVAFAFVFR